MSDPQFGMFSKNQGFEHAAVNYEFAIAMAIHCFTYSVGGS
jgi:hypothetical protein